MRGGYRRSRDIYKLYAVGIDEWGRVENKLNVDCMKSKVQEVKSREVEVDWAEPTGHNEMHAIINRE
jgi:hypothetical protein